MSPSQAVIMPNVPKTTAVDESLAVDKLIELFNAIFSAENTRLVRGEGEPIYMPADATNPYHRIEFAHGYFSSALHEIAHWCIAGRARRKLVDYGYWYCPDGRNAEQQTEFEKVEVKPQALEWAFSVACGRRFGVSTDNLNGIEPDRFAFAQQVKKQLANYLQDGFPLRAQRFIKALQHYYQTPPLTLENCLELSKDLADAAKV